MKEEKVVGKWSLRLKIGVILVLVSVCYGAASYFMHSKTLYPAFVELEYEEGKKDTNRITDSINNEIKQLDTVCKDWAFWDDTYQFAADHNQEYVESNLPEITFSNNELNFLYYFNEQHELFWGKMFDLKEEQFVPAPHVLSAIFSDNTFPEKMYSTRQGKDTDWVISGIINTEKHILLFSARPILDTAGEGQPRGIMVLGRFFDEDVMTAIEERTHVQFKLIQASKKIKPRDKNFIPAVNIAPNSSFSITEQEDLNLSLSTKLFNTKKEKSLILQVNKKAKVIEKGRATIFTVMESVIISLFVLLFVTAMLLNKVVLEPVSKLTEHIKEIIGTGDLSKRIRSNRSDEIGHLTRQYNHMLEELNRQRNELEELAVTDGLTRLLNHRKVMEDLQREVERCSRYAPELAVMMLDLDFFKNINDTYGHKAGDEILITVAKTLRESVRETDIVGRYGGEEFLVILPNQDREGAAKVGENIRKNVEKLTWPYENLNVTVSGGISLFPGDNPDELLLQADKRLYKAKEQGRNQIVSQ